MSTEKERAYYRERNKTPEQRAHRAKWADNNKEARAEHASGYRKRHPKKVRHRGKIRNMPKGKCARCGAQGAEKDHVSWNPPKVQWLCKECHQKKHGMKKAQFQGIPIHVETPKGTVRHWKDQNGETGETRMLFDYGYIKGTRGADGEEYDCYVGPDADAALAFVVHQNKKGTQDYDEDKVMLGFSDIHAAIQGYLAHYDCPSFLGSISTVPMDEFKQRVPRDGDGMLKGKDPKKTPAEPHERKRGSNTNKPGSAAGPKASSIKLSAETIATLQAKAKEHGIPLATLKAVYRRGAGAFSVTHHPKANRHSWAMGRVNSFIRKDHPQDNDLKRGGESTFGGANPGTRALEDAEKAASDSHTHTTRHEPGETDMEKRLKDPKGGLTQAGRDHFKRKEGANLKPGVKGAADTPEKMRRKGSFLTRFYGKSPQPPFTDEKGRPTRHALAAAAWGEPVPKNAGDAAKLNAKGKRLLERYQNTKKSVESSALAKAVGIVGGLRAEEQLEFLEAFRGTQIYEEAKQALRAYNEKSKRISLEHAKLNKLDDKARALHEKAKHVMETAREKARSLREQAHKVSEPYYAGYEKRHEVEEEWEAKKRELVSKLLAID